MSIVVHRLWTTYALTRSGEMEACFRHVEKGNEVPAEKAKRERRHGATPVEVPERSSENVVREPVSPRRARVRSCASSWNCTWCTGGGPSRVRRAASRAPLEGISPTVRCRERGWRWAVRPYRHGSPPAPPSTTLGARVWTLGSGGFDPSRRTRTDRLFPGEHIEHDLSWPCGSPQRSRGRNRIPPDPYR